MKLAKKVYCSDCAFFLLDKSLMGRGLCVAKAVMNKEGGDAIQRRVDVKGVALPEERNKRNNCKLYAPWFNFRAFLDAGRKKYFTTAFLQSQEVADTPVPTKQKKSKESLEDRVTRRVTNALAKSLIAAVRVPLSNVESKLEELEKEQKTVKLYKGETNVATREVLVQTEGGQIEAPLPPFIRRVATPSAVPGATPGALVGGGPGNTPNAIPGTAPGAFHGTNSGNTSGVSQGTTPGRALGGRTRRSVRDNPGTGLAPVEGESPDSISGPM